MKPRRHLADITALAPHADTVCGDRDVLLALPLNAAVHAAGHAITALVAGAQFERVTIHHDLAGTGTGCTTPPPSNWHSVGDAAHILSGPVAQLELLTRITTGARAGNITAVHTQSTGEFEDVATLDVDEVRAEILAVSVVRHWWTEVLMLTRAILEAADTTLSYDECVTVLGTRITGVGTRAHLSHVRAVQRDYAGGLAAMCSHHDGEVNDPFAGIGRAGVRRDLDLPEAA